MPAEAPLRVLLVEDDARLQTLGRKILERHGYQVLLASDGRLAVFHGPRRLADYEPEGALIDQISPARTAA